MVDQRKLDMAISSAQFIKLENSGDRFYEVETTLKKLKLDLPIQVAFLVYNYAKLRSLEFYYDFFSSISIGRYGSSAKPMRIPLI